MYRVLGVLLLVASTGCDEWGAVGEAGSACVVAQPREGQLALVQITVANGVQTEIGRYGEVEGSFMAMNLAHTGNMWGVIEDEELILVDTNARTLVTSPAPTDIISLSEVDDTLYGLNQTTRSLSVYSSWDAVRADTPDSIEETPFESVSRLTMASPTVAVGSWHSTDHVQVVDLEAGTSRDVFLQGFDDWIWGLDVVGNELFVLGNSDEASDARLAVFDLDTGNLISNLIVPKSDPLQDHRAISGLWCGGGVQGGGGGTTAGATP